MKSARNVFVLSVLLAIAPTAAFAQFTIDNPTGLAPNAQIFGPRYAVPDALDRRSRFDPYAEPDEGVTRFADPRFIERNVPPYLDRGDPEKKQRRMIVKPRPPQIMAIPVPDGR